MPGDEPCRIAPWVREAGQSSASRGPVFSRAARLVTFAPLPDRLNPRTG